MYSRGRRILFSRSSAFHTVFDYALDDNLWSGSSRLRHGCTAGCQFHGCIEDIDVRRHNKLLILYLVCLRLDIFTAIFINISILHS